MSSFSAVIFDFDYTLADSSKGVVECVNYALRNMGLPPSSSDKIKNTIGMSLSDTLKNLVGVESEGRDHEFSRLFVEKADEVMANLTEVYEDAPLVIRKLKTKAISLGIVSTKYRYRIENILHKIGLLEQFDIIVGGEDVEKHKPDPEGLLMAINALGSPSPCLYVGDSISDAEAGRRAGIPFVTVLSGVTPKKAFSMYPVYNFIDNLKELEDML